MTLLSRILCLSILALTSAHAEFYELRIYTAHEGKLEALHARFRDYTTTIFEKHGMTNVGYWVPKEEGNHRLVYLLSYPDRAGRQEAWKKFREDPQWKAAYAESTKNGKLVSKVESSFMELTEWSTPFTIEQQSPDRLFELREYTTNEGKLPNLHARFKDHTIDLFKKHGITNLGYFKVQGKKATDPADEITLIYFVAHKDEASRKASFAAFGQDSAWKSARDASEKDGKLLVKKGVKSTLLEPTDYSPTK